MPNNIHYKFITTPISEILKESVDACNSIGNGMEVQPLSEYVLQTTFLKMTGASEQKLKCLCWEMANRDYEYRYEYLSSKNYGECSSYKDKNCVYKDLIGEIKKYDSTFALDAFWGDKKKILDETEDQLYTLLKNSVISVWIKRGILLSSKNHPNDYVCSHQLKLNEDNIFENKLKDYYKTIVYDHRNRCAHNLKSYQNNLPTLNTLRKDDYQYENYFYRYLILCLLDKIFILLYNKYLVCIERTPNPW